MTAPSSSAPHTEATHVSSTEGSRSSAFANSNPARTTAAIAAAASAAAAATAASEAALPYRIDMDERGEVSSGNFKSLLVELVLLSRFVDIVRITRSLCSS
jgi:hypothetical protein